MMVFKDKNFYKIFYFLIFVFCFKEIFVAFDNIGPESFFQPNGFLNLFSLDYSSLTKMTDIIRWVTLVNSLLLLFGNLSKKIEYYLHCALIIFMTLGLAFRFSFSHYPQLEIMPLLIMIGFLFNETTASKIEISVKSISLVYFFSGVAKIKYSQWSWLDAESVQQVFLYSSRMRSTVLSEDLIGSVPLWIWTAVGIATLAFELLFPLIAYIRKADKMLFIFLLIFHISIALFIGIYSTSLLLVLFLYFSRGFGVFQRPTKA